MVAGGDISITGQGTTTSSFQGLILAEGSFKAKDTTLIGSALTLDKNGSVQLERVRTVAARDLTKVDLSVSVTLDSIIHRNGGGAGSGVGTTGGTGTDNSIGVSYKGVFVEFRPENAQALEDLALQISKDKAAGEVGIMLGGVPLKPGDPGFSDISSPVLNSYSVNAPLWKHYQDEVNNQSITYKNVFQLDFNKFLKTKGGLRPLLQRVAPL